jgi:hypothetical protein
MSLKICRLGLKHAVTTVDANMLEQVREHVMTRTDVWLEMDGGRFEHVLFLRATHGLTI